MTPEEIENEVLRVAIAQHGGTDPRTARQQTIVLLTVDSGNWSLSEFFVHVQKACDDVPTEFRSSIRVHAESFYSEYEQHCIKLQVTYTRPETQQELDLRVTRAMNSARATISSSQREVDAVVAYLESKGVKIDERTAHEALAVAKRGYLDRPASIMLGVQGGYIVEYPDGPFGVPKIVAVST